ncbi:MAG TPA: hypothetical protein VJ973_11235, partial [Christiangramia sp.]|nr:hypothetical protein [Christiangramia sp.]
MIKVYKFGGASVKDADGVKNLIKVLNETGSENRLIVVSAMGKTTNALEVVVRDYLETTRIPSSLEEVKSYHRNIMEELFPDVDAPVFFKTEAVFTELQNFLQHNKSNQYDFVYDQIVSYGELVSTTIVS